MAVKKAKNGWMKMCKNNTRELMENKTESLKNNSTDKIVFMLKSLSGLIPSVGNIASETISWLIPNQRIDRICDFIEQLSMQVANLKIPRIYGLKN